MDRVFPITMPRTSDTYLSLAGLDPSAWPGMTLAVAFRANAFTEAGSDPLLSMNAKVGANYVPVHMIYVDGDRYLAVRLNAGDYDGATEHEVGLGEDHVAAFTINEAGETKTYLDGDPGGEGGILFDPLDAAPGPVYLGACYSGGTTQDKQFAADAAVWGARIYGRELSAAEVRKLTGELRGFLFDDGELALLGAVA